jgi:transposase
MFGFDLRQAQALCEAAASLLLRVRKWSALRAWGLRIVNRSSIFVRIRLVGRLAE